MTSISARLTHPGLHKKHFPSFHHATTGSSTQAIAGRTRQRMYGLSYLLVNARNEKLRSLSHHRMCLLQPAAQKVLFCQRLERAREVKIVSSCGNDARCSTMLRLVRPAMPSLVAHHYGLVRLFELLLTRLFEYLSAIEQLFNIDCNMIRQFRHQLGSAPLASARTAFCVGSKPCAPP